MDEEIICKRCGTSNDYRIEVKANNHVAYCNGCGGYLKNIPHDEPRMYFGRYKGLKIEDIYDKSYLEWILMKGLVSGSIKTAIEDHIKTIVKNG